MTQNFIAVDREQAFLLPPDVRDWLGEAVIACQQLECLIALPVCRAEDMLARQKHGVQESGTETVAVSRGR
jgi:hypothetical protein